MCRLLYPVPMRKLIPVYCVIWQIRTVDTDILLLPVISVQRLHIELFVAFGTGKILHLSVHGMVRELGPDMCVALPM